MTNSTTFWKAVMALQGRDDIKLGADLRPIVRAVLEAIREPNEAMLDLGADADGWRHPSSDYISAVKRATVMWRTMIDAILKEGT